jgi:hypothetical protein
MPIELQVHLAVGMKYMLPPSTDFEYTKLLPQYEDLCNRLRWRIHFLFQSGGQDINDYDPDWEVAHETPSANPSLRYIEHGLAAGRKMVQNAVDVTGNSLYRAVSNSDELTSGLRPGLRAVKPEFHAVRRYLIDNDLIVTGTDKNLGIAVSKRQWYNQKCLSLLENTSDYEVLSQTEADEILNGQCNSMRHLALLVEKWDETFIKGQLQLPAFLRSSLPKDEERPHMPKFHGIPKIHKVPTAMRPIIPCHSAVINPAAKFVQKVLDPIVKDPYSFPSASHHVN